MVKATFVWLCFDGSGQLTWTCCRTKMHCVSQGIAVNNAYGAQESVRVTHNRDIVPSVPPQFVGFHHVAREVWQLDGEKYFGTKVYLPWVCDGSGEDPVCHNSVCFMGLCTSIADHMHYMGADMYHRNSNPC